MSEGEKKKPQKPKKPNFSAPVDLSVLEKAPPHDLDAEKAVLGALLRDPELCDDVVMVLRDPDDFYHDAHKRIFSHMKKMRSDNSKIDLLLLVNNLKTTEELEMIGGQFYLGELMTSVPVSVHAIHYAKIVKDKATLRRLIHAGSDFVHEAYAPETQVKDLLNRAALQMALLCESQTTNQVTDMTALMDSLSEWITKKEKGLIDGIKTGFIDLDKLIEGFHHDELLILAARTGMGKTALALNFVNNIAISDKQTVLFVSLEMGGLELAKRLVCGRAKLNGDKLRKGFLNTEEYNRFSDVASELSTAPLFIDDTPGRSVSEISAVARRLKRQHDLKLIVVDYIGLITPENLEEPRQEQVAKIARRLKLLARELHVPVLCLAQLNRQADTGRRDDYPRLSQLRESGAIEQDADVVMFIHRKDKDMSHEDAQAKALHNQAVLIVAKQRNGATDDIPLYWRGDWMRFFTADEQYEQEYENFGDNIVQGNF